MSAPFKVWNNNAERDHKASEAMEESETDRRAWVSRMRGAVKAVRKPRVRVLTGRPPQDLPEQRHADPLHAIPDDALRVGGRNHYLQGVRGDPLLFER